MSKIQTGITIQQLILGQGTPYIYMQSSTIHEITTQSENTLGQRATSSRLYSCSIISGPLCSPIVGRLDGLRKDCGGFCQEVERVGSDLNCAGSLCLKVLHCNQFQSLTLTTLYRHIVGICRIVDRLRVAVVILLCRIVVDCVERQKERGEAGGERRVRGGLRSEHNYGGIRLI